VDKETKKVAKKNSRETQFKKEGPKKAHQKKGPARGTGKNKKFVPKRTIKYQWFNLLGPAEKKKKCQQRRNEKKDALGPTTWWGEKERFTGEKRPETSSQKHRLGEAIPPPKNPDLVGPRGYLEGGGVVD